MNPRRSLTLTCAAAIVAATLTASSPSAAQDDDPLVEVAQPDGTRVTIRESERQHRLATLQRLLNRLSEAGANRGIVLAGPLGRVLVEHRQFFEIADEAVLRGTITAAEKGRFVSTLEETSRVEGNKLYAEIQALRAAVPAALAAAGSTAPYFPVPMDWGRVRGTIQGIYLISCTGTSQSLPDLSGRWTIELRGDGTARGIFTSDDPAKVYSTEGRVQDRVDHALIEGAGPHEWGEYRWTVRVEEWERALRLAVRRGNSFLELAPARGLITCSTRNFSQVP